MKNFQYYLTVIPAALIAITFHEMSHAYTAYLLGDPTAKSRGRLSLNPLSHLDPIGFICMVFFGFGWAKPVPIDPRYLKKPKLGMAITALAGPVSNFLMGFAAILIYVFVTLSQPGRVLAAMAAFFRVFASLNVGLGVFNLLPVPPLDGSKIMFLFLPNRAVAWFYRYEGYIRLGLLLCLYLGFMDGIIGWGQNMVYRFFINRSLDLASLVGLL